MMNSEEQVSESFSYKWKRRETYDGEAMKQKLYRWLVHRYFGDEQKRNEFMIENQGKALLDAGCGSGFSASVLFGKELNGVEYLGVDASDSVGVAETRFQELGLKGNFIKDSISTMRLDRKFDIIFCEGVLHHTPDPYRSLENLVFHLNSDGIIMFYVYKKKGAIRERTDDFIRGKLDGVSSEEAWKLLMPLTKLGKTIGDLNIEIPVDEDVALLGIPKGRYDLQRVLYWLFIKMYYDKDLCLDEMNHINFDWYKPAICYRFQPEEVENWLYKLNLEKQRFIVEESGVTAIGKSVHRHCSARII